MSIKKKTKKLFINFKKYPRETDEETLLKLIKGEVGK